MTPSLFDSRLKPTSFTNLFHRSQDWLHGLCDWTISSEHLCIFMASLCHRAGHYIFALWFLLSFFLSIFLFLAQSQPSQIACLPYFHTWCGLSANLGCRSETCRTWLAGNAGPKKSLKKVAIWAPSHICRAISSQLMHVSTIGRNY